MCADIVKFPGKSNDVELIPAVNAFAMLRTAFEVHAVIIDGLAAGDFDGDMAERSAALQRMFKARYYDLAPMAEGAFEIIYGVDPFTFLEHVQSYRG